MQEGQELRAARAGFWLGFRLMPRGERARAQAWFARAQRILDRHGDRVERGYVLLPATIMKIVAGEIDAAEVMAKQATAIGERYRDRDLIAFARALHARVFLRRADLATGLSMFDDVMLEASSQELSPTVTGLIYCNVIAALTIRTPLGRKARPLMMTKATPLIRTRAADLARCGVERAGTRITGVRDGLPVIDDGHALDVRNVVWCTGYDSGQSWIDLPIHGVGRDAARISDHIAAKLRPTATDPATRRLSPNRGRFSESRNRTFPRFREPSPIS